MFLPLQILFRLKIIELENIRFFYIFLNKTIFIIRDRNKIMRKCHLKILIYGIARYNNLSDIVFRV